MANRLHEHHRTLRDAEVWLRDVPRAGSFRVALVYPNLYYVGMSNLGFQAVFELLNAHPDVVCERAFLPDDVHTDELERTGSPLVSFDTATPLRDFDMVAFSVSFENDYLHVLKILRLAGIPLRAKDRGPRDPLVVLGGAAIFLNPEPLALFADLVAAGEGEALVPKMMDTLLGAPTPRQGILALRPQDGFYVPAPLRGPLPPGRDGRGLRRPGHGGAAARLAGEDADAAVGDPDPPHRDGHEVHGRDLPRLPVHVPLLLGGLQLPARARLHAGGDHGPRPRGAAPHPEVGLVSTAVCDHPEIDGIVDDLAGMDYQVSVASLRLDDLTPGFVLKLVDTGVEGLTLAPECGSDRMRKILNKQFTNEDILARAEWIFGNGIQNLKLYYMAGLPFEGHGDVEAIVELTAQIREVMLKVARGRGRIGRLHPSVNPFVPKPGTPYQWLPMEDPKETDKKLQYLRKAFGKMPNVDAIIKSARTGVAQSALALGDRRLSSALEVAVQERMDFKRAMREAGLDPAFYLFRGRGKDEVLPWDIIDNGVSRAYFWRELDKARQEALSPHCPEIQGCIRCGVCVDTPNPSYKLPEKWKHLGTSPRYLKVAAEPAVPVPSEP